MPPSLVKKKKVHTIYNLGSSEVTQINFCAQTPPCNAGVEGWKIQGLHLCEHLVSLIIAFDLQDRLQRLLKENGGPYLWLLTK